MKYVAIDIETLGLNVEKDSLLQIAAVTDDTENQLPIMALPFFSIFIDDGDIVGHPVALEMHLRSGLWKRRQDAISTHCVRSSERAIEQLMLFLMPEWSCGNSNKIVLAGKNIGKFDWPFLRARSKAFTEYSDKYISHRFLDPSEYFVDFKNDIVKPDLKTCRIRAGLGETETAHDALADCYDIVKLVRFVANRQQGK